MKNIDHKDPNKILEIIREMENMVQKPAFDLESREDIKVQFRVDESIGPAKFRPDPLIPGGYLANSLTIKAVRPDIFVLGDSVEDLSVSYQCSCGEELDLQFWKFCPFCSREFSR